MVRARQDNPPNTRRAMKTLAERAKRELETPIANEIAIVVVRLNHITGSGVNSRIVILVARRCI
jgi:hypothetical protein